MVKGFHVMSEVPSDSKAAGVPKLLEALREDLAHMARLKGARFPSVGGAMDILSLPGTWAVILYRLANTAHHKGIRPLSRFLFFVNCVLFGAELYPSTVIQPGLVVPHPFGIGVGDGTRIGRRAMILGHVRLGGSGNPRRPGSPVLGDDVVLMDSCKVFGPVHVGQRCIVGTNAVVTRDIGPDMFVFGSRGADEVKPLALLGLEDHAQNRAEDQFAKHTTRDLPA